MRTKLSIFCDKIVEAGWLVAVIAVPLYFNIYSARTFEPDKITLLRSVTAVMILAWLVSTLEKGLAPNQDNGLRSTDEKIKLSERLRQLLKFPLFLPTALLVLVYLISTIFSLSPQVSLWGSYQRLQGTYSALSYIVIFALSSATLRTREQVDRLITTVIIASIPISLYGIVQKYGLDPLPWAGDVTTRVAANMGNAIFVASYLTMIIPLTLSRLIEAMTIIIKEEQASWGHTFLAAIYIFTLAIQIITVIFSQSRGPMLGILGASFVMGVLFLLLLRQSHSNLARLSLKEFGLGLGMLAPLGLAGATGAALGFLIGFSLENLLPGIELLPLLGAAIGGMLGFFGLYVFTAAADIGWRWLWLSWLWIGILAIVFVVLLNLRGTSLDPYLDPVRELPYISRLANVIETEGTGKVRVLIWNAAMKLVMPHAALGIPGDEEAPLDRFNLIRPLIGYGPESMFNAFAYVYPIDLAYVENRGSSADRSHNETMDSLVITGMLGFLAFYGLMISLFYYVLNWLGWAPDRASRRRLIILLGVSGVTGAIIAYVAQGGPTFMPLGLPLGVVAGVVIHLTWQGLISQAQDNRRVQLVGHPLLLIGLIGAIIGHFIEVHFVFSIAATYTYFWTYVGLIVALSRMSESTHQPVTEPAREVEVVPETASKVVAAITPTLSEPVGETRRQKRRARQAATNRIVPQTQVSPAKTRQAAVHGESLETWVGSQGLVMAIIFIILTFDFITPQFQFDTTNQDSMSLLWMMIITWLAGLAITLSDLAIRRDDWEGQIRWGRAIALYVVPSLSYFFFYMMAHRLQLSQRISVSNMADVIRASDVLTNGLLIFYLFLLLLMVLFALMLCWGQTKRLSFWRSDNWWLYPPLVLAAVALIWFKNFDVVWADIYLKEGERYRSNSQWNEAIALHEKGRSIDDDEDFYYLMLALDYQLMAQDGRLDQAQRQTGWREGERIALEARRINSYNPDNTGNMGRYYFTMGQVFSREYLQQALTYFGKAVILAPSNVIYHNLLAQTDYILGDYQKAVDRLKISTEIDPKYPPTWILLGDTYAAMQQADESFKAHSQAIKLSSDLFDQFAPQRFNFYASTGKLDSLLAVLQQAAQDRPMDAALQWAIAHVYNLKNEREMAITYLQKAITLGDNSDRTARELAALYLALNQVDQAMPIYQKILQANPKDMEANSALAFIYAQKGQVDEAIQANQVVLEQKPNDYDTLKNLAILYQQKGQLQEALNAAKQAQAVAPQSEAANWAKFITDIESQLAKAG